MRPSTAGASPTPSSNRERADRPHAVALRREARPRDRHRVGHRSGHRAAARRRGGGGRVPRRPGARRDCSRDRGRRRARSGLRVRRDRRRRGGDHCRHRPRRARWSRRRVQHRRDRTVLPDRDPRSRRLRSHHRGEPAGDVPRVSVRHPASPGGGRRRDREHHVDLRHRRQSLERGLRGVEGWCAHAHQGVGGRIPPPRHPGQRDRTRNGEHQPERGLRRLLRAKTST